MKKIAIIISSVIILLLNTGTNCFSQQKHRIDTILIDGHRFLMDQRFINRTNSKNITLQEKKIEHQDVPALSIKDANDIRKKYEADGWTYDGMYKNKDGILIVCFSKEIK